MSGWGDGDLCGVVAGPLQGLVQDALESLGSLQLPHVISFLRVGHPATEWTCWSLLALFK